MLKFTIDTKDFDKLKKDFNRKFLFSSSTGAARYEWRIFLRKFADSLRQWYVEHLPPNAPPRDKEVLKYNIDPSGKGFYLYTDDPKIHLYERGWEKFDMRYSFLFNESSKGSVQMPKNKRVYATLKKLKRGEQQELKTISTDTRRLMKYRFKHLYSEKFAYGSSHKTITNVSRGGQKGWMHEFKGWNLLSKLTASEISEMFDQAWDETVGKTL